MEEEIPEPYLSTVVDNVRDICKIMLPMIRKQCKEVVPSVNANLIKSLLKLLQTFLDSNGLDLKKNAANLPFPNKAVMVYLSYSLIWSLGANLHESSRSAFGIALRVEMKKRF
jgi:dynein heavy chain